MVVVVIRPYGSLGLLDRDGTAPFVSSPRSYSSVLRDRRLSITIPYVVTARQVERYLNVGTRFVSFRIMSLATEQTRRNLDKMTHAFQTFAMRTK